MTVQTNLPVEFFVKVGGSDVYNQIGSIDLDVEVEPITDENRKPGDVAEANLRVVNFDIVAALRAFADQIEQSR